MSNFLFYLIYQILIRLLIHLFIIPQFVYVLAVPLIMQIEDRVESGSHVKIVFSTVLPQIFASYTILFELSTQKHIFEQQKSFDLT